MNNAALRHTKVIVYVHCEVNYCASVCVLLLPTPRTGFWPCRGRSRAGMRKINGEDTYVAVFNDAPSTHAACIMCNRYLLADKSKSPGQPIMSGKHAKIGRSRSGMPIALRTGNLKDNLFAKVLAFMSRTRGARNSIGERLVIISWGWLARDH